MTGFVIEPLYNNALTLKPDLYKMKFKANSYSVGTIWMNDEDAQKTGIRNGDLLTLENPLGRYTKGRVFVSGGIRPGVIKLGFATGGRFSPGMGPAYKSRLYTPSHNDLVDPQVSEPHYGFPSLCGYVGPGEKGVKPYPFIPFF